MKEKHILCGIQPTGRIHLGNYLGTLKDALELQEDNRVTFLVAQYHAMTACKPQTNETIIELGKLGAQTIVTQTPLNTLLMWELACECGTGDLFRMTQYKDKKETMPNCGILIYPLLMAADIMLVNPDYVLTGIDQKQHLELTRKLCKKTGRKMPEMLQTKAPKIMSIADASKKMSKSLGDKHCVYLGDLPVITREKFKKAPTDAEGLANLKVMCEALGVAFANGDCQKMKEELAEKVVSITE